LTEPFVRPDVRAFLDFLNNAPGPKLSQIPIGEARAMMRTQRALADAEPTPLAVVRDLAVPGPAGDVPIRFYDAREQRQAGPALIYFHGGGFVLGDLDSHHPICTEIADVLDMPVIAVDYRLAPEHPWPAAPDDCEAVARWVAQSPDALGRQVDALVLAGDSAGGALTAITTLALHKNAAAVPVIAQWPLYPVVDMDEGRNTASYRQFGEGYLLNAESMAWFDRSYAADTQSWRAAPMKADLSGLPPTLVTTAGLDPLRDQGRLYAAALVAAGVETIYQEAAGIVHGFVNLRKAVPSAARDIADGLAAFRLLIERGRMRK